MKRDIACDSGFVLHTSASPFPINRPDEHLRVKASPAPKSQASTPRHTHRIGKIPARLEENSEKDRETGIFQTKSARFQL
jgi:hypothetical protein